VTAVLDAFAVLALLKGEPAARQVQALIEAGATTLTVVGLAEVIDHLVRIIGVEEEDAALDLAQLGLAEPQPLSAEIALHAGFLSARHYHRATRAVSLADCTAAEAARSLNSPVATSDPHLLDLCSEEGIDVIPLADTRGSIWSPDV
jgi:PIN domain nuclease of toxin-antitoxin system